MLPTDHLETWGDTLTLTAVSSPSGWLVSSCCNPPLMSSALITKTSSVAQCVMKTESGNMSRLWLSQLSLLVPDCQLLQPTNPFNLRTTLVAGNTFAYNLI